MPKLKTKRERTLPDLKVGAWIDTKYGLSKIIKRTDQTATVEVHKKRRLEWPTTEKEWECWQYTHRINLGQLQWSNSGVIEKGPCNLCESESSSDDEDFLQRHCMKCDTKIGPEEVPCYNCEKKEWPVRIAPEGVTAKKEPKLLSKGAQWFKDINHLDKWMDLSLNAQTHLEFFMETARVSGFPRDYAFGGISKADFEKLLADYWVDKHWEPKKEVIVIEEDIPPWDKGDTRDYVERYKRGYFVPAAYRLWIQAKLEKEGKLTCVHLNQESIKKVDAWFRDVAMKQPGATGDFTPKEMAAYKEKEEKKNVEVPKWVAEIRAMTSDELDKLVNKYPIQVPEPKKTAEEWYREDTKYDILDPDGWPRDDPKVEEIWWTQPITQEEYLRRRSPCTITTFMHNEHRSPFKKPGTPDPLVGMTIYLPPHTRGRAYTAEESGITYPEISEAEKQAWLDNLRGLGVPEDDIKERFPYCRTQFCKNLRTAKKQHPYDGIDSTMCWECNQPRV
jgi:hypothetical protein